MLSKKASAKPVPATIADVWVSGFGGGAGDRCVLAHQPSEAGQLTIDCWPLAEPVAKINAKDFTFTVPLPPKPAGAGKPRWRVLPPPPSNDATAVNGGRTARLKVKKRMQGSTPSLEVTVKMTKKVKGGLPTGFAGRLVAGWNDKHASLTHVRVSVSDTGGAVETVISDDAPGERRRAGFDAIAERARSLSGRMSIDPNMDGGTAVRIVFPPYRVRR